MFKKEFKEKCKKHFKMNTIGCLLLLSASAVQAQSITGQVLDQTGSPVEGAEISVVGQPISVTSNTEGHFVLEGVSESNSELHIEAEGFSHVTKSVSSHEFMHEKTDLENPQSNVMPWIITLQRSVMEVIDISATPLHSSSIESALPVNVITADNLRMKQASTLGETLKNEVGIHSTYYGPVSSSPIIRGFNGPRVLITQNGLDVGDASRVGPDHVVSSETSTAESIEVLRGPATLFYGSGAIGGVVNVVDKRIPQDNDKRLDYMVKHNTVSDENEASISLNTGAGAWAIYADGFTRESNDYDIPDYASSEPDEHDKKGTLANSSSESSGFTLGSSYLLDNGYMGFSYGYLSREYGIPGHHHEEEHEEEHHDDEGHEESEHDDEHDEDISVTGDLTQKRYQFMSDLTFNDSWINRMSAKLAYTDYEHKEIENGIEGTRFTNDMTEAKFDFYHQAWQEWQGAFTLHYKFTDFESTGEEAFTPPSETETFAMGWVEEKHFGNVLWQLGARVEQVDIDVSNKESYELTTQLKNQDFTPVSASVGAVWDYQPGYNIGMNVALSQRAPSSAELYANGAHIGTNTYELGAIYEIEEVGDEVEISLGDQDVELETLYSLDFTWRKFDGDIGFIASAFYNYIEDYYYQANTGLIAEDSHDSHDSHDDAHDEDEESHGLPIYIYQQHNARIWGLEAEVVMALTPNLKATVFSDYVKAELTGGENLPRIPPLRLGNKFNYEHNKFSAELSVTHTFDQHDYAPEETSTDGYTIVDANINYYINGIGDDFVVFLKADNITDEEARVHTSFLKDDVTLPGRGFSMGVRGSF